MATTIPFGHRSAVDDDMLGLRADLKGRVEGEVRFDPGTRAVYSTDASNYRQVPIAVVVPRTVDAAVEAVNVCREHNIPVLSRGGGTSLAGQCCNAAVVLDWSKYCTRVVSIDADAGTAVVEPGIKLDSLNNDLAGAGWMVGPRPSTHVSCTLGGMIGNNSCGATAQAYGKMVNSVRRLEILTYDGLRMWVEPTSDGQYQRILDEGGRRAEIYRGRATSATSTPTRSAPATPTSPAACRVTTWTRCCRRTTSMSPGCWSAAKAPW